MLAAGGVCTAKEKTSWGTLQLDTATITSKDNLHLQI